MHLGVQVVAITQLADTVLLLTLTDCPDMADTVSTIQIPFKGSPKSWTDFLSQLADDPERNRIIVSSATKSSGVVGNLSVDAPLFLLMSKNKD
jgi:hypothetical protein